MAFIHIGMHACLALTMLLRDVGRLAVGRETPALPVPALQSHNIAHSGMPAH